MVRIGPKKLFKHSLWVLEPFFSLRNDIGFFLGLGRNLEICSILTCYVENNTLVMYLSMKKIKLSIYMCH